MPASSAPPLPSSEPSTLLLQRRLSRGDSRKWRTLLRLMPDQMPRRHVRELVRLLHGLGVTLAKAHRHPAHRLPFGEDAGDHVEMDVTGAARRLGAA